MCSSQCEGGCSCKAFYDYHVVLTLLCRMPSNRSSGTEKKYPVHWVKKEQEVYDLQRYFCSNAFFGEYFEQQGMGHPAIDDVDLAAACIKGLEA